VAAAIVNKGITLTLMKRGPEAIAVYDDVIRRYGESAEPALRDQVSKALLNKAITFSDMTRSDDEIAVYNEIVRRYAEASELPLLERVASALSNRGVTYDTRGRGVRNAGCRRRAAGVVRRDRASLW